MSQETAIVASVEVKQHSKNACAIFLGNKRVGYVGYGNPAPISWLPKKCTGGMDLTTTERIAVVKRVREIVAELAAKRAKEAEELRRLENDAVITEQGQESKESQVAKTKPTRKKPSTKT